MTTKRELRRQLNEARWEVDRYKQDHARCLLVPADPESPLVERCVEAAAIQRAFATTGVQWEHFSPSVQANYRHTVRPTVLVVLGEIGGAIARLEFELDEANDETTELLRACGTAEARVLRLTVALTDLVADTRVLTHGLGPTDAWPVTAATESLSRAAAVLAEGATT